MDTAIVLFTRDLRTHDNPALAAACDRARAVVPLFVLDPALDVAPHRAPLLGESVAPGPARGGRCSSSTRPWPCRRPGPGSWASRSPTCARNCARSAAT